MQTTCNATYCIPKSNNAMSISDSSLPLYRLYNEANHLGKGNLQKDTMSQLDRLRNIEFRLENADIVRLNATKIRDWEKIVPLWKNDAGSGWKLPTYFPQNIGELVALKYNPKDSKF